MKDPNQERSDALEKLATAVTLLEQSMDVRLIPVYGTKLGYAIRGAREINGVAAVQGGIIDSNGKPHADGPCAFGVDEDIARIVLTAMKFDPIIRCAATLRFSGKVIGIMERLLLECNSFDPAAEPPGISTMDWGVASCCKQGLPTYAMIPGKREKKRLSVFLGKIQSTYRTILL